MNIRNILLGLSCCLSSPGLSPAVELKMVFRESCGAWLQSAYAPQHAQLGKSQGHIPVRLRTCCPGRIPLWHCWHSASTAFCVSKFREFTVPLQRNILLQLSRYLRDFVKLNQAPPPSSPLQMRVPASFICPPEAAAPSSWPFTCLFLSFLLFHYPHLEMQDEDCTWYSIQGYSLCSFCLTLCPKFVWCIFVCCYILI